MDLLLWLMETEDVLGNMELVQFSKQKIVGVMAKAISVNRANLSQTARDTDVLI